MTGSLLQRRAPHTRSEVRPVVFPNGQGHRLTRLPAAASREKEEERENLLPIGQHLLLPHRGHPASLQALKFAPLLPSCMLSFTAPPTVGHNMPIDVYLLNVRLPINREVCGAVARRLSLSAPRLS